MAQLKKFLLALIIILAVCLRFWNLSQNPPGLTWDEVSLGYNAYSIIQTGRDEYGTFLPLNLKSFGDWKPAVYAYLTAPFVAIFGLNELSIRLPSAILGATSIILIYFLVYTLFQNRTLSLLSALFLAISPWHIQFSRPGFEANVALFFNILGIYLFVKKKFVWSALIFGLSFFTYQGSRLFVPLILIALVIIYKQSMQWSIHTKLATIIFIIFLSLMFYATFLGGQSSRLATQNFFAYERSQDETLQITKEDGLARNSLTFNILHGQWWSYTKGLIERYLIYFSPKMLFIDGDYSERHSIPDLGALYYFSVVLIPLGIFFFLRNHGDTSKLLFAWLLIAPITAVLSRDLISTLRAINMVIPWVILEAGGLFWLVTLIKKLRWFYLMLIIITVIITANFIIYFDRYFIHATKEYSRYWLYGYKQSMEYLHSLNKQYDKIIISDSYGQPYIYFLFYTKYPPEKFQKQAKLDQPGVDVGTVRKIDNIEFRHIYWPADRGLKNSLFIGPEEELPTQDILPFKEFSILKEINFLNGENAFKVVEIL